MNGNFIIITSDVSAFIAMKAAEVKQLSSQEVELDSIKESQTNEVLDVNALLESCENTVRQALGGQLPEDAIQDPKKISDLSSAIKKEPIKPNSLQMKATFVTDPYGNVKIGNLSALLLDLSSQVESEKFLHELASFTQSTGRDCILRVDDDILSFTRTSAGTYGFINGEKSASSDLAGKLQSYQKSLGKIRFARLRQALSQSKDTISLSRS